MTELERCHINVLLLLLLQRVQTIVLHEANKITEEFMESTIIESQHIIKPGRMGLIVINEEMYLNKCE